MSWRATLRRLERRMASRPGPALEAGVRLARAVMQHRPAFEAAIGYAQRMVALGAVPGQPAPPRARGDALLREAMAKIERHMAGRWPDWPRESPGRGRGGRGARACAG